MRARSDDYNYDYLTDEEYQALDWDASLSLTCHSDDAEWAELVSHLMWERCLVSRPDGFSVLPVDADLGLHLRAVSVRELTETDTMELDAFFHGLPWDRRYVAKMTISRNDGCVWEFGFN